ncbi:MAG: hypothetical protein M3O99_07745 [Chloroflexota bacterium]|nr:hypothetical protein [Chloroflexota bacterium]
MLSLGIYLPLWLGFTWAELRRETGDQRMQPLGHALSVFIPGYGYWQVYRHFALIASALGRVGVKNKVDPFSATIGVVLWSLTFLHYSSEPMFVALDMIELVAATGVVVYGQRALNEYWRARPGPEVEERVLSTDWIALALAGAYFLSWILAYATTPST